MPKTTKTPTPRPSPVAKEATSAKPKATAKPRKSPVVVSSNHELPTTTVSASTLEELQSLKARKPNELSEQVAFNALFNRQNKFGGWEFTISDGENDALQEVIHDSLGFEGGENTNTCITLNEYNGHYQIRGKLSQAYKASAEDGKDIPVPVDGSIVSVTGRLEVSKIKGKTTCYLQIDNIEEVVSA